MFDFMIAKQHSRVQFKSITAVAEQILDQFCLQKTVGNSQSKAVGIVVRNALKLALYQDKSRNTRKFMLDLKRLFAQTRISTERYLQRVAMAMLSTS